MTEPVVLFAPIGPYMEPVSQLIWALYRKRNMPVVEAHVVADRRALMYARADLLGEGRVLDQLRDKLGPAILGQDRFFIHAAETPDGVAIEDDLLAEHREIYLATMWSTARKAIAIAQNRPVVFGLVAGRRRTTTSLVTACYVALARKQDKLLDVRISDRRVDHGWDFFFPEQSYDVNIGHAVIKPSTIDIQIVDVELPRLGGLLEPNALDTFDAAMLAGQTAIDALRLPLLEFDLWRGTCALDHHSVGVSAAELLWFAFVASARRDTPDGWVVAGQAGHPALAAFARRLANHAWVSRIRTRPLQRLIAGEYVDDEDLRNLRAKTIQRLKRWCADHAPAAAGWIVPESDGRGQQRLRLTADQIRIAGLPS